MMMYMKILAKALCDELYYQEKVSLMGVFQQIFILGEEEKAYLRGNLFISLAFEERDAHEKRANIRVFVTNNAGKEVRELFSKNLIEHVGKRGVNVIIALDQEKKGIRKLSLGTYDFWITLNDGEPEWITQCLIAYPEKMITRKKKLA